MTDVRTTQALELVSAAERASAYIRSLLPAGRPRRISRMNGPQSTQKYTEITDKSVKLTEESIRNHVLGRVTYAASLHTAEDTARCGVIEIDAGGFDAIQRTLAAARDCGLTCIAFRINAIEHDGGHVWFIFDTFYPIDRIVAQLRNVANLAGLPDDVEIWPRNQGIRLPFGLHRRVNSRGDMLTQSGEVFHLDNPDELAAAIEIAIATPTNSAPPEIAVAPLFDTPVGSYSANLHSGANLPLASDEPKTRTSDTTKSGRFSPGELGAVREKFNREHTWHDLLTDAGGTQTRDGYACHCGVAHSHETQLLITSQDKLLSYSNRCRWAEYREGGKALDKFGFYVRTQHNDNVIAALKELNPRQATPRETPDYLTKEAAAQRRKDRERKAAERAATAEHWTLALYQRAIDYDIPRRAQIVLDLLLKYGAARGWCSPSLQKLIDTTGYSESTIHRALADLEDVCIVTEEFVSDRGYTYRGGRIGRDNQTAKRTFLASPLLSIADYQQRRTTRTTEINDVYRNTTPENANRGVSAQSNTKPCVTPDIYIYTNTQEKSVELVSAAPPPVESEPRDAMLDAFDSYEPEQVYDESYFDLPEMCLHSGHIEQEQDVPNLAQAMPTGDVASYDPARAIAFRDDVAYTGTTVNTENVWQCLRLQWQHYRNVTPQPQAGEQAEQGLLADSGDVVPVVTVAKPTGPDKQAKYRAKLDKLSRGELAAELVKMERSVRKYNARWAKDARRDVQEAIERYDRLHAVAGPPAFDSGDGPDGARSQALTGVVVPRASIERSGVGVADVVQTRLTHKERLRLMREKSLAAGWQPDQPPRNLPPGFTAQREVLTL